jgi:hypothetical protein
MKEQPQTFPLDEANMKFIQRYQEQIVKLQEQLTGAMNLILEQHGLQGRWELDLPNKQLVCAAQAVQSIEQAA